MVFCFYACMRICSYIYGTDCLPELTVLKWLFFKQNLDLKVNYSVVEKIDLNYMAASDIII